MNRQQRRAMQAVTRQIAAERPAKLTLIPRDEWVGIPVDPMPKLVWISKKYLVQLYETASPDHLRLSMCRTTFNKALHWNDGLSWDEIQAIKREVGFGDWYAVEVYPRDRDVINDSNMRHLWLFPSPLNIGWFV